MAGTNGLGDWEDAILDPDVASEMGSYDMEADDEFALDDDSLDLDDIEAEGGASEPWGPGAGYAHLPMSMAVTDRAPLGSSDEEHQVAANAAVEQQQRAEGDPGDMVRYDRSSYERGHTYGSGIFDMPDEGYRSRDGNGIFDTDFAMPDYIGDEPEVGVWESEMLDLNTGQPRVVQGNTSGVQLARQVPQGQAVFSPFAPPPYGQSTPVRTVPGVPQPRGAWLGRIEQFGNAAAAALLAEAHRGRSGKHAERFVQAALEALGPGKSRIAMAQVRRLRKLGYPPGQALHQTVAHLIMHATADDLRTKATQRDASPRMPSLDRMAAATGLGASPQLNDAARQTIGPLTQLGPETQSELESFFASPAGREASQMLGEAQGAPGNGVGKYLLLGAAVLGAGYVGWRWWQDKQQGGA